MADSQVLYLEGYLFDPPAAQAAFRHAAALARAAGRQVALSLSDAFCVDRHRAAFRAFITESVDILFANEAEVCSLYEENTFDAAAARAGQDVHLAALTRSEEGSVILRGTQRIEVPAAPATVVDTTGAGDAYAAGFPGGLRVRPRPGRLRTPGQLGSRGSDQPSRGTARSGPVEHGGKRRLTLRYPSNQLCAESFPVLTQYVATWRWMSAREEKGIRDA